MSEVVRHMPCMHAFIYAHYALHSVPMYSPYQSAPSPTHPMLDDPADAQRHGRDPRRPPGDRPVSSSSGCLQFARTPLTHPPCFHSLTHPCFHFHMITAHQARRPLNDPPGRPLGPRPRPRLQDPQGRRRKLPRDPRPHARPGRCGVDC